MPALTVSMGLLSGARVVDSPNCDARPGNPDPELIVVHGISLPPGRYGGPWIDALFTNLLPAEADPYFETIMHLRVSSHVLIARDGSLTAPVPSSAAGAERGARARPPLSSARPLRDRRGDRGPR